MKRRAFLRGASAAGGAAFASRLWRPAEATRPGTFERPLERLQNARIAVAARVAGPDAAGTGPAELMLGRATSARRELDAGTLALRAAPVAGIHDAVELFVTFRAKPHAPAGTVSLALELDTWSRDNYVMLPGACYAGNRFESRFVGYPPLLTEPADIGPHVPPIVTDIPRLNLHRGPSRLEIAAADLATPAVAVFLPAEKLGLILLVDPATSVGRTGLSVAESDDRARASIAASTPFVHEGHRAEGHAGTARATDPAQARRVDHAARRASISSTAKRSGSSPNGCSPCARRSPARRPARTPCRFRRRSPRTRRGSTRVSSRSRASSRSARATAPIQSGRPAGAAASARRSRCSPRAEGSRARARCKPSPSSSRAGRPRRVSFTASPTARAGTTTASRRPCHLRPPTPGRLAHRPIITRAGTWSGAAPTRSRSW